MGRIVAIDYGSARLGVALSDVQKIIPAIQKVIPTARTRNETISRLLLFLKGYEIEKVIIGWPLKLDGSRSHMTTEVQEFMVLLEQQLPCPLLTCDERLSTALAERLLKEAQLSRKKRKPIVDGLAAALLLQNYLNSPLHFSTAI